MRLIGILFVLCLAVSIGSCFNFGDIGSAIGSVIDSILGTTLNSIKTNLCTYLQKNPDRLQTSITKLNECVEKYDKTKQIFNATLTYLNQIDTQQALIAGSTTCSNAIDGLYNNLCNDLKKKNFKSSDATNILADFYKKIKN